MRISSSMPRGATSAISCPIDRRLPFVKLSLASQSGLPETGGLLADVSEMASETIECFLSLAIGFAMAGVVAHGYQVLAQRPLSFMAMTEHTRSALAAVPLLVFAAPFIIMRGSVGGNTDQQRNAGFVAVATVIAGFWSLMSGTVVASGWAELMRLMT